MCGRESESLLFEDSTHGRLAPQIGLTDSIRDAARGPEANFRVGRNHPEQSSVSDLTIRVGCS